MGIVCIGLSRDGQVTSFSFLLKAMGAWVTPMAGSGALGVLVMPEEKCGNCDKFIGGGDWNLCCTIKYDLCYENTPACGCFNRKTENKEDMVL